jgi:N-acylglucosamine 2-epimerase
MDPAPLATQYRRALLEDVLPFWEHHSLDAEHGGYFSCLDREGHVYDTDKFVWLQARQAWTFARFYNSLERKPQWLEVARHGIDFLRAHGRDGNGHWYFSLTREGDPLTEPFSIFSDCFAAMAFAQYGLATGDDEARDIARTTFGSVLKRRENPRGRFSKTVPWTRPFRAFAIPMILLNLVYEMDGILEQGEIQEVARKCVADMEGVFLDRRLGVFRESVAPDGSAVDSFEGRLINPGHGIEGTWFLMEAAVRLGEKRLIDVAVDVLLRTLEFGWDQEHGGIFYFLDADGRPPVQLEWDQKLWWVHLEALVALTMAVGHTGSEQCRTWYDRVHEYSWQRFPDPEYGEWWGYLNRTGQVLLPVKGGKWKGCFHVPRALYRCWKTFEEMAQSHA